MEEVNMSAAIQEDFEPYPAAGSTEEFMGRTFHFNRIPPNGKPWVMVYATNSRARFPKPVHNVSFYNDRQARVWIDETKRRIKATAEFREQRKAARKAAPVIFTPGDVWYRSWGYEQTNVDFYQVTRVTARGYFSRQLCQNTREEGFMQGPTVPCIGEFRTDSKEFFKLASASDSKWNGKPVRCSWYA